MEENKNSKIDQNDLENLSCEQENENCSKQNCEKEKYQRLYADFENYKRRVSKEKEKMFDFMTVDVAKKFLPILGDFERSLNFLEKDSKSFEGITLIKSKFIKILDELQIKKIEIKINSENLDPNKHEAISTMAVEDNLKEKIVQVIEDGFSFKEETIKVAKVIIGI
jgi:molecular chaperone GrpE